MIIGIIFAGFSLYKLNEVLEGFTVEKSASISSNAIVYYVGIRLSYSIAIIVIAYFFLSLYKKSIDDNKFYSNEITNIKNRMAAISLACLHEDEFEHIFAISSKILDDDRNSVVFRDEDSKNKSNERIVIELIKRIPNFSAK